MLRGILQLLVIFAIGAILADVLAHPKGTAVVVGGINSILKTGYSAASGTGGGRGGSSRG